MGTIVDDGFVDNDRCNDPLQPLSSCFNNNDIRENVREHDLQWYFFTTECVCKWARKFERSANARLQN